MDQYFLVTEIQDTGIGMHKEDLDKLFMFLGHTLKQKDINKHGMGFGLTFVKLLVHHLNGEIDVCSKPEEGTNFRFKLPILDFQYPLSSYINLSIDI